MSILAAPTFLGAGPATSSASFLKIGVGARAEGMGGAFVGLADDSSALFRNPAGLAELATPEVSFMHLAWIADVSYDTLAWSQSGFGLGLAWLNAPPFNSTADPSAATAYAREGVLSGGYGRRFGSWVAAGVALKGIFSDAAGSGTGGLGADLGVLARPFGSGLSFGLNVANLGTVGGDGGGGLPMAAVLGVNWAASDRRGRRVANGGLEAAKSSDSFMRYKLGGEWWLLSSFALRLGTQLSEGGQDQPLQFSDLSTLANLSAGLGAVVDDFQLDYATVPYGALGATHRVSASWKPGLSARGAEEGDLLTKKPELSPLLDRPGERVRFWLRAKPKGLEGMSRWKVEVLDADSALLKDFEGQGSWPKELSWDDDGSGERPSREPATRYRVEAWDKDGRPVAAEGGFKASSRAGEALLVQPAYDAVGGRLVLDPNLRRGAKVKLWRLEVLDAEGKVLRRFEVKAPLPKALAWDGTDAQGRKLDLKLLSQIRITALEPPHAAASETIALSQMLAPKDMMAAAPRFSAEAGGLVFKPMAYAQVKVKEWKLTLRSPEGKVLKTLSGIGALPKDLVLDTRGLTPGGADLMAGKGGFPLRYSLEIKPHDGPALMSTEKLDFALVHSAGLEFPPLPYRVEKGREIMVLAKPNILSKEPSHGDSVPFVLRLPESVQLKRWRLEIEAPDGSLVRTFKGEAGLPEGLVWDGRDEQGREVEGGSDSRYRLIGEDASGARWTAQDRIVVRQPFEVGTLTGDARKIGVVWYPAGNADIDADGHKAIGAVAKLLLRLPSAEVYVQGHCSAEGDPDKNLQLSQERADRVLEELLKAPGDLGGRKSQAFMAVGYSSRAPLSAAPGAKAARLNRRTDIMVIEHPGK